MQMIVDKGRVTLNAHMCAYNGEDGRKNWSQPAYTHTKWMNDSQQFF